jgi:D-alanyl-D-alanine carboxypeptidase/D-alanyl-D-alanine-endopeptidase (penicillin-binding protein 4)
MRYVKSSANFKRRSRRSRVRKRRRLAVIFFVLVLAAIAFALRPRAHKPAVDAPALPAARIARVKRTATPWGPASRSELRAAVRAALATALDGGGTCSCVVIAQDGTVLYDDGGSRALTPASTEKIIVSDAALADLGALYRFDTLLASTKPVRDGAVDGDLWLAGSGDPSLRSDDLRAGIAALRKLGVQRVDDGIAVDGSAIAGEEINPFWNADDSNEDFMAATSGVSLDEDTVEFHVTGASPGEPAAVRVKPQSSDVHYYGSIATGSDDDAIIAATATPNLFRLDGSVPPGTRETFYLPVHGIEHYAGAVLTALAKAGGISVHAPPRTGTLALDARILWEHRSQPLAKLLQHMLVFSDNHFAEQFMRTLGGRDGDTPDDANGIRAERAVLTAQEIPVPGLHLVDGSGLAHANRVAAITLARILAYYDAQRGGNILYPLMARGGRDGTLKMYDFQDAQGRVRAKSGHVAGVASLAGYVDTRKHGRVVFAFLIDGSAGDPDAAIVSAVDRIAQR